MVYKNGSEFKHGLLVSQIKIACKDYFKLNIGNTQIIDFITECKNLGMLTQDKARGPYRNALTKNDNSELDDLIDTYL